MDCKKDCPFLNIENDIKNKTADIVLLVESEAAALAFSPILSTMVTNLSNALKLDQEKLYLTEMYKCPVGEEKLTKTKLKKCLPILKKELDVLKPKYILSFSRQVTSLLLGGTYNYTVPVFSAEYNATVIPLFGAEIYSENSSIYTEHIKIIKSILSKQSEPKTMPYVVLLDTDRIIEYIDELKKFKKIAFDIETTGLDMFDENTKLLSIGLSVGNVGHAFPIDLKYMGLNLVDRDRILNKLAELFNTKGILFIGHNLKFDIKSLDRLIGIKNIDTFFDTMIGGYVLDETSLSNRLEAWLPAINVENYKGFDFNDPEYQEGSFSSMDKVNELLKYNAKDASATLMLADYLFDNLSDENINVVVLLTELTKVLINVELNGIRIDTDKLKDIKHTLQNDINTLHVKLMEYDEVKEAAKLLDKRVNEINFDSPQQVAIIFKVGKYPVIERTPTGAISTGTKVLTTLSENYDIPFIKDLEEFRKKNKILNGFILPYMDGDIIKSDGRIHTTFHITGTVTGRLSSSNPNLQQIPRGNTVKQLFLPEEGHIMVNADYSQMELRVMAALSGDPKLLGAYRNGIDVHALTASLVYNIPMEQVAKEQRQTAKMVNFAILYGSSARGLAYRLNRPEDEMTEFIKRWYEVYADVQAFNKHVTNFTLAHGYIITPFNRYRHLPDVYSSNGAAKAHAIRQANNFIIQSTASDMTLLSLIQIHKFLTSNPQYDAKILSSVHDSIVLSINQEQAIELLRSIKSIVESYNFDWMRGIRMEAEFSVGTNYAAQEVLDTLSKEALEKALSSVTDEVEDESGYSEEEIDI